MHTLFIDTHSELITVALLDDKVITKTKESHYKHGVYLMPMIRSIILENNLTVKDIKNIVAINGPGSFTGLRIGLSAAKTMAYLLNVPIYLISSLTAYLVSSDINEDKMAIIEDNKGYYISVFSKDNKIVEEEKYVENIDNYNYKVVENKIDVKKVVEKALSTNSVPCHLVRASYVKKIEVEK